MIQLKRILVPTDFSDSSQAGLNCGCELAARFSAELQLLHVSGRWDVEQSVYPKLAEFQNEAEQGARTQLEELPAPSWRERLAVACFVQSGEPFLQIVRHAKSNDVDLIVMGTHGRTGWSHTLIGSVAEKVVRKAPCPVLTIRQSQASFVPRHVLVATDFGLHAERAVYYAAAFASAFSAELHVLHVVPDAAAINPLTDTLGARHPWMRVVAEMGAVAASKMEAVSLGESYPDLTVRKEVRGGLPIAKIVEYVAEQSIDLAVVGTHGRGALAQVLIGGVAERVVRHAACPVLTVHHPEHEFVKPNTRRSENRDADASRVCRESVTR